MPRSVATTDETGEISHQDDTDATDLYYSLYDTKQQTVVGKTIGAKVVAGPDPLGRATLSIKISIPLNYTSAILTAAGSSSTIMKFAVSKTIHILVANWEIPAMGELLTP